VVRGKRYHRYATRASLINSYKLGPSLVLDSKVDN
jgi:hypothetical protein